MNNLNSSKNNKKELYIGLLSGTSIDNIDAAIFEIDQNNIILKNFLNYPIDNQLKQDLNYIINNYNNISINQIGLINKKLGIEFAHSIKKILANNSINTKDIKAIGFHGQTIFHNPEKPYNFTIQIGCPSTITEMTGIPVITDFRQKDMVQGGQGAPLAPVLHQKIFANNNINRAIINIGGITNITLLLNNDIHNYIASDLGPGNTLLDQWCKLHQDLEYDKDGLWATSGKVDHNLLDILLQDPYFEKSWPKSTGREYFNLQWLNNNLKKLNYNINNAQDIQRTLLELTVTIVSDYIINYNNHQQNIISEVYLCGGGAHNKLLFNTLEQYLNKNSISLYLTNRLNMPVDWVESALFAYLAYCNLHKNKLNLKYITGNKSNNTLLGCVYY